MYPEKQSFKRNEVVVDTPIYTLHKFHKPAAAGTPVFIVPPHAGRHGNIVQRLIDICVEEGRPVYAYELKSATQETKDTSIEDLVSILSSCIWCIGNPVDLICNCQGAWLGALLTARYPYLVKRYVNFVGPINLHTGQDNIIENYMKRPNVLEYHQKKVDDNSGIQLGSDQWFAFSMVNPWETYIGRFATQAQNLIFNRTKEIEKWENNESWYDDPQDLAGTWFMESLDHHFKNNRIYNGTMPKILGGDVNLKNITCPVYLFGGGADPITHHQQVTDMANVVGSDEIHTVVFPDEGHTSSFVKEKPLKIFKKMFFDGKTYEVATDEAEKEIEQTEPVDENDADEFLCSLYEQCGRAIRRPRS